MTPTLFALLALCPGRADLASVVEAVATRYRLDSVALVVLIAAESTCNPAARNRRSGATGLMGILPDGDANPAHLTTAALMEPGANLDLGAAKLAKLLALCGGLGQALTLYHGGGKKSLDGRTRCQIDDHARKLMRRIRWVKMRAERVIVRTSMLWEQGTRA